MAQKSLLQLLLDAGMSFTAMTQRRAEAIIRDLVASGHVHTDDVQRAVSELLERGQRNAEKLVGEMRSGLTAARNASAAVPFLRPDVAPPPQQARAAATPVAKVADAPVKAAPVKAAPVKAAPVKAAPVKAAPVKAAPVKAAPVKKAASASAAVRKSTTKTTGVKRTSR